MDRSAAADAAHPNGPVEFAWRGLDDDARLDVVSVDFDADGGFVATGRQSSDTYRAQWDLVVDANWRTRLLTVDVEGWLTRTSEATGVEPDWQRHLNLWRRDVGRRSQWRCETGESGDVPPGFAPMGLSDEDAELLTDAVDVDLAGCPLTNTMPIRRLDELLHGPGPEVHSSVEGPGPVAVAEADDTRQIPLTLAWASIPDLTVRVAHQSYAAAEADIASLEGSLNPLVRSAVRYRSATRAVDVTLTLDSYGVVVDYPGLADRITDL